MTPIKKLSWAENHTMGALSQNSIKLMYFGGMWCPYCPPFTKRLKIFFDTVREVIGENVVEVIFVSSDSNKAAMLQYYGEHHGDWFAVPYEERAIATKISEKFGVTGIPSLHVIGNDGEEVAYFTTGGTFDMRKVIRNLPDSKSSARGPALELYKTLKENYMPEIAGFLGLDFEYIVQAIRAAREGESCSPNLFGDLKDLKSGKFAHAARGLQEYLKVDADWKEEEHCTFKGIEAEVESLKNCPECAEVQAAVLTELNRMTDADFCKGLAGALRSSQSGQSRVRSLKQQVLSRAAPGLESKEELMQQIVVQQRVNDELMQRVENIRSQIKEQGGWYYGCDSQSFDWPKATVEHAFGAFKQPLCEQCRKYRLDYTTISADLHYVLYEKSSQVACFNGVRDSGRVGATLSDFMEAEQAKEADLTEEQVASLRFYTSHSFGAINEALRDADRTVPHPLPAITTTIQNGLRKLRRLRADSKGAMETVVLWRGFRDIHSTEVFMTEGGTELAPMSTTTDVKVAVGYAVRKGQTARSLLFRIVTDNNLQRGADIQWLSMFPGESETLYPPLTYMQPTGRQHVVKVDNFELIVVEIKATLS